MIPLKSTNNIKVKGFPFINVIFILICVYVFIYELRLPKSQIDHFFYTYGVIPDHFLQKIRIIDDWQILYPYVTSLFVHAGWLHIIGNMLFLAIFGNDIEKSMGHIKYFFFFLLCGIISGLAHTFMNIHSAIPSVGASGAIAGVLGSYFLMFPRSKITTILPLIVVSPIFEIPALVFLGIWFLFQFLSGTSYGAAISPVAWWAHIGGFVVGMLLTMTIFRCRK